MKDWYSEIPKVELHRHLEGAVRLSTVAETAKHHNLPLPHRDLRALRKQVQVLEPLENLEKVLAVFMATQSTFVAPEVIERITFEAVEDAWYDGIRLLELRYSPMFLTQGHQLTFDDAFDAIQKGLRKARAKYDIPIGLIAIATRVHGMEQAQATLAHVLKHRNNFCGFDLADNEAGCDFHSYSKFFQEVHKAGIPITIHAGEEKGMANNVVIAIRDLHAARIGHGVQIVEDESALRYVQKSNATLELCPTSNYLTHAIDKKENHPIRKLLKDGVRVTINSDDPGIMGIDLTNEYRLCGELLNFSRDDFASILRMGIAASFIDSDQKQFYERKYFGF